MPNPDLNLLLTLDMLLNEGSVARAAERLHLSPSAMSRALALARGSELIAMVPERHTSNLRAGLHAFELPVALAQMTISLLWHPRMEADPAHRWLRQCVHELCSDGAAPL